MANININGADTNITEVNFNGDTDINYIYLDGVKVWQKAVQYLSTPVQTSLSGTSLTATYTVTAPAGTNAAVVCIGRNVNQSRDTTVSSVTLGGTSMTEVVTGERTGSEYNSDASIWALNKTYGSDTSISITVTYGADSSANYGKVLQVLFLENTFNSYTPSSSYVGNSTTGGSVSLYEGGLAVGVAVRTGTAGTYFGSGHWVSSFEPDYFMTYQVPTADGTGTLSLTNTNTSYGRAVTAIASWDLSKFD